MKNLYLLLCIALGNLPVFSQPSQTDVLKGATFSLNGKALDIEPTVQSSISFGAVTNSTMVVNFSGGDGAKRILVVREGSAVDSDPADGITYTGDADFGSGSPLGTGNYAVYTGTGNTQLITGLIAGTTYHFAVYEYNDAGGVPGEENYLLPGGTDNTATIDIPDTYTWQGSNGVWTIASNWFPSRDYPATNDILLFNDGGSPYLVTDVPNQTIGYFEISNGTNVTFQAGVNGNALTVSDILLIYGYDLFIDAGSSIKIDGSNACTINLLTGTSAFIGGDVILEGGAHKIMAADSGAITFFSGSTFTAGTGLTGHPFGSATANSVIFEGGTWYNHMSGSDPFSLAPPNSVAVFQSGSLFKMLSNDPLSLIDRNYGDVEIDAAGFAQTESGSGSLNIDNLTLNQGSLYLNQASGGISIKGNIYTAPGTTLGFEPAVANTVTFNGTTAQSITTGGTFIFGINESLTIDNAAGVSLNSDITLGSTAKLVLTTGILKMDAPATTITLSSGTTLTGGNSNASYVDGMVKKIGNSDFIFPVGKTGFGYVPIGIKNAVGSTGSDEFTAGYFRGSAMSLGPITAGPGLDHVSGCDYWILEKGIATPATIDVTAYWSTNNFCSPIYINNLANLTIAHFDGTGWDSYAISPILTPGSTTTEGSITWMGVATFSPFALGSTTFANPLPISINYFTGIKHNGIHLLNWKVNCNHTPTATMELQRSSDGRNYSGIYTVTADALQCQQPFIHPDEHPLTGVNYYRLKMTDANGKITYSSIVPLINADKGFDVMNIAPNPVAGGSFNLNVSAAQKAQLEIVITDMQGRVMQKNTTNAISGFNTLPVNVSNLASGTYQLFVNTAEGRSRVLRFVVQ